MLGVTTETRAQMNYAGSRMAPWLGHTMVSRQEVPRPLLTPGEVMQLPACGRADPDGRRAAHTRQESALPHPRRRMAKIIRRSRTRLISRAPYRVKRRKRTPRPHSQPQTRPTI
jgi:hypothetical protein